MRIQKLRIVIPTLLFVVIACRNERDDLTLQVNFDQTSDEFQITNNPALLSNRVLPVNRTANMDYVGLPTLKNGRPLDGDNFSQIDYYWYHIASVSSPYVNGETLSATHFDLMEDYAYVSYHKQGDTHLGAVEILDLSDPYNPQILSQLSFVNADVNALTANSEGTVDRIWLAASHKDHGAVIYESQASPQSFENSIDRINLSNQLEAGISASANGICFSTDKLIVTSGKTYGGTFILDKSNLSFDNVFSFSNAKYVATSEVDGVEYAMSLITGDDASLYVNNLSNPTGVLSHSIGGITHRNVAATYRGKSTMEISPLNSREVMVAMGANGVRSFDILTGELLKESKGTMLLAGNSNGVTMDEDFIYIANGADGLAVAEHPESSSIDPVFHWDTSSQPASVNYVKAEDNYLFVAKGEGGFHILEKIPKDPYTTLGPFNGRGKPLALAEDLEVCSELLTNIFSQALPERQNALTAHPEYFEFETKNITVEEDAEISVTFIHEGAGYKNILGYYSYTEGNEPETIEDLEKIIIFPNASAMGSGGDLVPGNTMKLLGEFDAGTTIGFFLIANGWKNKITDGYYTQYTDINLNMSGRQQSIIFHDTTCGSTVICFEDINVPNGDNDFNDAIFQITANPPSAINPENYIQF